MIAAPLLVLVFGVLADRLLTTGALAPDIDLRGGVLTIAIVPIIGWLVATVVSWFASTRRWVGLVVMITSVTMVLMVAAQVAARPMTGNLPPSLHDGAVQTAAAARALVSGHNPYAYNYEATPFGAFPAPYAVLQGTVVDNAAWMHYAYGPATFILAIPLVVLADLAHQPWSLRWLSLAALGLLTWKLARRQTSWNNRALVVVLVWGNPFLWPYAVAGYNDFFMSTALALSLLAMQDQRPRPAGIWMGLAIAFKQTAWIALPIWLLWLWQRYPQHRATAVRWMALVAAIFYLPFLVWSPHDLWIDMVQYVSGALPLTYPISGLTLWQYPLRWRLIASPWSPLTTWPIQLVAAIGAFGLSWSVIRRAAFQPWMIYSMVAVALTMVSLVSRFVQYNHLIPIICLALTAWSYERANRPT